MVLTPKTHRLIESDKKVKKKALVSQGFLITKDPVLFNDHLMS